MKKLLLNKPPNHKNPCLLRTPHALKICYTFVENADKRLRNDDATELALLGATETAASDFTSDICNRKKKFQMLVLTAQEHIGITWPIIWAWCVLWPPHQTGHTSNCGAPFPLSSCCHRCHSRCLRCQRCPSARRRHCPGTYQPRSPHESRSFWWDLALSCTKAQTHFSFTLWLI